MIPNCQHIVERLRDEHPEEWRNAHTGNARTEDFIRRLAWVLHTEVDARFGLLGQRGSATTIADDAVLFKGQGPGHDPVNGGAVSAFDVIIDAGSTDARPGWGFINVGGPAVWVQPTAPANAAPPPPQGTLSPYWTPAHDAIRQRMTGRPVLELAQQLAHTFPAEGWGQKRTSGGDWSRDTIGRIVDGKLWAVKVSPWKVYGFLGSDHAHRPVSAINHLGDVPAPIEPPPVEPPPVVTPPVVAPPTATAVDLTPVLDAIAALAAKVEALAATPAPSVDLAPVTSRLDALSVQVDESRKEIQALAAKPITVEWPEYSGRVFGTPVTLRPRQ
jgi:hypothetical protein